MIITGAMNSRVNIQSYTPKLEFVCDTTTIPDFIKFHTMMGATL